MKWIFTHGDTDGVAAAALAKVVYKDAKVFFTHPHGLFHDLLANVNVNDNLIILDIALDERLWKDTVNFLSSIKGEVLYIDHHPLPEQFQQPSFEFIHKVGVSTSELIYKYFRHVLPREYSRVALFGAVGDYSDETDYIKSLYNLWDKRLIYFEAGILCQGLEASKRMYDFKRKLVDLLANNELPSQIEDLVKRAIKMSYIEDEMRKKIKESIHRLENLSYVIEPGGSLGRAARYVYVEGDTIVGIAVEFKNNTAIMSIRRRKEYVQIDLNKLLRKICIQYGGSGGGHLDAAGARIPKDNLNDFLVAFDQEIAKAKF